jgi:cytosine/uracil/thiamine/allantoin permease
MSTESNVADMLTELIVGKAFTIKAMYLLGEIGIKIDVNINHEDLNHEKE